MQLLGQLSVNLIQVLLIALDYSQKLQLRKQLDLRHQHFHPYVLLKRLHQEP